MIKKNKYRLVILVILFNKEISNSVTAISLSKALESMGTSYEDVMICFWNNGPKSISSDNASKYYCSTLIETLNNESLSIIYNRFLEMYDSDHYLILDHDSKVGADYINECLCTESDYMIPTIINSYGVQSPIIHNLKSYTDSTTLLALGSGICLSSQVRNIFKKYYETVFDERYYFYGVDSTFFLRLNQIGEAYKIRISNSYIIHSLSKFEKEDDSVKKFRKRERSYDQALTLRYYFSKFTAITVFKKIISCIMFRKTDISFMCFFYALLSGKHYKSIKR